MISGSWSRTAISLRFDRAIESQKKGRGVDEAYSDVNDGKDGLQPAETLLYVRLKRASDGGANTQTNEWRE